MKKAVFLAAALFFSLFVHCFSQTSPRFILSWDPILNSNLARYIVRWGSNYGTTPGGETSVIITAIDASTTYEITVAGIDVNGNEGQESAPLLANFGWLQPATPSNFKCISVGSGNSSRRDVTCTWDLVTTSRLDSQVIVNANYRLTRNGQTVYSGGNTYFKDRVRKNQTLYYAVLAVSQTGIESLISSQIRVNV